MFNIVMVDYNKVDDSLTWLDFIKWGINYAHFSNYIIYCYV